MKQSLYNPYELEWEERISFPSTRNLPEYGNRIYNRYPARSVFLVPRAILAAQHKTGLNILDPFMGSGTTAVETVLAGDIPFGIEMDPFAQMVSNASVGVFTKEDLSDIQIVYNRIIKTYSNYKPAQKPDLTGIERWFKSNDLIELLQLRACIDAVTPQKFLNFFIVTFADSIKPVSLMERQSLKPYISKRFPKITKTPSESFLYSFNAHFEALISMCEVCNNPNPIIWLGDDATDFNTEEECIDIAISSPPYINALDYVRCIKVESALCGLTDNAQAAWMRKMQVGHEVRRKQTISEVASSAFDRFYIQIAAVDAQRANTCMAYFNDIYNNLMCVFKSLKVGGEYHVIIGDNVIRKIEIPTHSIIMEIAEKVGFTVFGLYSYAIKDHRTSIPRNTSKSKIYDEYVIMLKKI